MSLLSINHVTKPVNIGSAKTRGVDSLHVVLLAVADSVSGSHMARYFCIIFVVASCAGCAVWPVGDDPKGREYRIQAESIIGLLERYQQEKGEFPPSLSVLVPAYAVSLPDITDILQYSPETKSMGYTYTPSWPQPGQISCSTLIGSGEWSCHGYI
jgi:hypothetical protein